MSNVTEMTYVIPIVLDSVQIFSQFVRVNRHGLCIIAMCGS